MKSKRAIQLDIKASLELIRKFSPTEAVKFKKEYQKAKNDLTLS